MKPLGMTSAFQISQHDRIQDEVWDAVSAAINAGWTPEQFVNEAQECWIERLREMQTEASKDFDRIRKETH